MDYSIKTLRNLCQENNIPLKSRMLKSDLLQLLFDKNILKQNEQVQENLNNLPKSSIKRKLQSTSSLKKGSKKEFLKKIGKHLATLNNQTIDELICEPNKKNPNFLNFDQFILNNDGFVVQKINGKRLEEEDVEKLIELGIPFDIDKVNLQLTKEFVCEKCAGILDNCSNCTKKSNEMEIDEEFENEEDDED